MVTIIIIYIYIYIIECLDLLVNGNISSFSDILSKNKNKALVEFKFLLDIGQGIPAYHSSSAGQRGCDKFHGNLFKGSPAN